MAQGTFVFLFFLQWKLVLLSCLIVPLSLLVSGLLGKPIAGKSYRVILQTIPFAACILYGGWLSINGEFQPAELLIFVYMLGYFVQLLKGTISNAMTSSEEGGKAISFSQVRLVVPIVMAFKLKWTVDAAVSNNLNLL